MTGAREFLAKVLPWEQAGPDVYYNVHWRSTWNGAEGKTGTYWDGRASSNLDAMVRSLAYSSNDKGRDYYICMSAQSRCEEKISRVNKPYKKAIRFRENVVGIKSFYIDVDVKPEAYKTQREALDAFKCFIDALDLPDPSIVVGSGGGGFHAHWVMDCVLDRATWQPVANALALAAQKLNLICDTQCTVDAARILRVPGTLNYKYNPPAPVTLMSNGSICSFDDFRSCLQDYIGITPVGNTEFAQFPFPRREPTIDGSELSSGIVLFEGPRPKLEDIVEECAFMGDAWAEGGKDYNNPQWFVSVAVASWLEDGHDAAHQISYGHPGYTKESTDAMFERAKREHTRGIGWTSCAAIQRAGASQCASCPHFDKGKSPLNFAHVAPTLAPTSLVPTGSAPPIDILPPTYSRQPNGHIYIAIVEDSGAQRNTQVCHYEIRHGWLQDSPWKLHFTSVTSLGKEAKIELSMGDFGALGGPRKALSAQGMVLNDREYKLTQEFLVAWIQTLQRQKNAVVSSTPFGWTKDDAGVLEGFTFAGRMWGDGFDRPAALSDPVLAKRYTPTGKLQPWLDAAKMITDQKRPGLDAMFAASFAAPLLRFVGYSGAMLAAVGNTGIGKTTALLAGISVWGSPQMNKHGLNDTGNSLFNELGKIQALPIYWDEIQDAKQASAYVKNMFSLTGGTEKARSKRDGTVAEKGVWNTMMVSSANVSLFEAVVEEAKSHNAGLARMFEIEVPPATSVQPGQRDRGWFARKFKDLDDNFGNAGLIYAQFLGANFERIKDEMAKEQDRYVKKVNQQDIDRFWVACITALMAGARYANELKLTEFDLPLLEQKLLETLERMRRLVSESPSDMTNKNSVANILAQFNNAMRERNTLVTNKMPAGAGKPAKGAIQVLSDTSKLGGVFIHIARDDKLARISSTQLSAWLGERNMPRSAFIKALEDLFGFKRDNGILGAGTAFSTGTREYYLEVSTVSPRLTGYIEWADR